MRLLFSIFVILLFNFCPQSIIGQNVIGVKKLTIEDGLSDRIVRHIIRDTVGFFYIISENQIQRFDGDKFFELNIEVLTTQKIKPNEITYINLGENGQVLLADKEHKIVGTIKPASLTITDQFHNDNLYQYNGVIWDVSSFENGYKFTELYNPKHSVILQYFPDNIVLSKQGVYVETDSIISFYHSRKRYSTLTQKGLITSAGDNVYLLNDSKIYTCNKEVCKPIYSHNQDDLNLRITKPDLSGNLMVGYGDTPRFIDHFIIVQDTDIIVLDTICNKDRVFIDCYADNAMHKIMTGGYTGLHIFTLLKRGATIFKRRPPGNEMFGFIVSGLAIDKRGVLTFVNEGNGIYQYNNQKEPIRILQDYNGFRRNGKMHYNASDDLIYANGYYHGNKSDVYALDTKSNIVDVVSVPFKVRDIVSLGNKLLTIAGYTKSGNGNSGVLYSLDFTKKKIEKRFSYPQIIYDVFFDEITNTYWAGTRQGLLHLDNNFNLLEKYDRHENDFSHNIDEDFINYIKRVNKNLLVGSIGGGLYIVDLNTGDIIKHLNKQNGLSDNKVVSIEIDNNSNLWVATFNGLNVLDSNYNIIRTFYQQDGLPDKEFNSSASAQDQDGKIYFGTVNGLLIIDPKIALNWPTSHGIYFDAIQIQEDNKLYESNDLSIKNTTDSIIIQLLFPDFNKEPFEKHYIKSNDSKVASGQLNTHNKELILHQFQKGNGNLTLNSKYSNYSLSLPVKVSFDYWPILKTLGIILFFLLILIAWNLYQRQKTIKKIELNKRIAGLELTALQAQMNPHFLFNALGAIQYFIQTHNAEKADEYLSNFAQLMRIILESSKSKFTTIENEIKLMQLYVGLEKIRFEDKFDYSIEEDEEVDFDFRIPPMIVQPFIENAVNHGLIHLTDRKGLLKINIHHISASEIEIVIEDNGIGRKKASNFVRKNYKSRGMQIVNERISTFNTEGNFYVVSKIIDLYDDDKANGTRVILRFTETMKEDS